MAKIFNIAGPCDPESHYMLPAMARLPGVKRLIEDQSYFVVHAQRQCGKTTAFRALVDDINSKGERVALYCSLEVAQAFPDSANGIPVIYEKILREALRRPEFRDCPCLQKGSETYAQKFLETQGVAELLGQLALFAGKPFVVFFDEADCLSDATLVSFLRQLRDGCISRRKGCDFPSSIALIGMRNIRDYKARIRPDSATLGSASPFNVITEAMTLRTFTESEVATLYRQHTDETGQVFEPGVSELAFEYSGGQPYLVNALAKWCVDKIHDRRYSETITLADMHDAKEKIIRERGTHLDSLMERMKEPRVRRIMEPVVTGGVRTFSRQDDDCQFVLDLGLLVEGEDGALRPANPIYAETIGRYLSRDDQDDMKFLIRETPWVKDDGLDMPGLMVAFQQFWRENAGANKAPFDYNEAYPHIVLQAFLQRVTNGGGEIIREMSLGRGALDLGVRFRGATYAVEIKMLYNYEKDHAKAHVQMCRYLDHLGVSEGWLVVFDPDLSKPWDGKIYGRDEIVGGKKIHVVGC